VASGPAGPRGPARHVPGATAARTAGNPFRGWARRGRQTGSATEAGPLIPGASTHRAGTGAATPRRSTRWQRGNGNMARRMPAGFSRTGYRPWTGFRCEWQQPTQHRIVAVDAGAVRRRSDPGNRHLTNWRDDNGAANVTAGAGDAGRSGRGQEITARRRTGIRAGPSTTRAPAGTVFCASRHRDCGSRLAGGAPPARRDGELRGTGP